MAFLPLFLLPVTVALYREPEYNEKTKEIEFQVRKGEKVNSTGKAGWL